MDPLVFAAVLLAAACHAGWNATIKGGLKQIDAQADQLVEKSVAFADEAPEPAPKDLYMFDYATEVPNIDRTLPGDHTGLADVEGDR